MYPDDLSSAALCRIEGWLGPNCTNCGSVTYRWLGFNGFLQREANRTGLSRDEVERWYIAKWTIRDLGIEEASKLTEVIE